jgi:hypothetical protein
MASCAETKVMWKCNKEDGLRSQRLRTATGPVRPVLLDGVHCNAGQCQAVSVPSSKACVASCEKVVGS